MHYCTCRGRVRQINNVFHGEIYTVQNKFSNCSVCVIPNLSGFHFQCIATRYERRSSEKEFLVKNQECSIAAVVLAFQFFRAAGVKEILLGYRGYTTTRCLTSSLSHSYVTLRCTPLQQLNNLIHHEVVCNLSIFFLLESDSPLN